MTSLEAPLQDSSLNSVSRMTSTIGIPIKLLNEAQACHLTKASLKTFKADLSGAEPCRHPRDHIGSGLQRQTHRRYAFTFRHQSSYFCLLHLQTRLTDIIGIYTAEDNMNVQLKDITVTARDGRVSHLDQVYIRGSHVRFFIVPDMLRFVNRMMLQRKQLELYQNLIGKESI